MSRKSNTVLAPDDEGDDDVWDASDDLPKPVKATVSSASPSRNATSPQAVAPAARRQPSAFWQWVSGASGSNSGAEDKARTRSKLSSNTTQGSAAEPHLGNGSWIHIASSDSPDKARVRNRTSQQRNGDASFTALEHDTSVLSSSPTNSTISLPSSPVHPPVRKRRSNVCLAASTTTVNTALLTPEEMLAAIKLNVDDILRDPATPIMRLRVSDAAQFYDAGPSVSGFSLSPNAGTGPTSPVLPAFSRQQSAQPSSPILTTSPSKPLARRTASLSISSAPNALQPPSFTQTHSLSASNVRHASPSRSNSNTSSEPESAAEQAAKSDRRKKEKFLDCLCRDTVDLTSLRKLAWTGIPPELRPMAWQLLLGYLPAPSARRVSVLARKRQEYADAAKSAFSKGMNGLDQAIWHQIHIDVPRTNPGVPLWSFQATQRSLERILYVWAIRHPASGYVQGINDLVTPFFQVFLSQYVDVNPESFDVGTLPEPVLAALEADSFWCLSKLLDGIQDNYIFAQPGIQRQVSRLKELCERVDAPLAHHLAENNVEFIQFAFKWIHLLLLRVLPVDAVIRMWDTYMSESTNAFSDYHTYVCLAFLLKSSAKLREMDFQSMMLFFQSPVEHGAWSPSETEVLLSEGFLWKSIWSAR